MKQRLEAGRRVALRRRDTKAQALMPPTAFVDGFSVDFADRRVEDFAEEPLSAGFTQPEPVRRGEIGVHPVAELVEIAIEGHLAALASLRNGIDDCFDAAARPDGELQKAFPEGLAVPWNRIP